MTETHLEGGREGGRERAHGKNKSRKTNFILQFQRLPMITIK